MNIGFSHLDNKGKAKMVDVTDKKDQIRTAVAAGKILLAPETIKKIEADKIAKGNVLTIAQVAGIQAAKKTSELIPLCHNLPLTKVAVDLEIGRDNIKAIGMAKCKGATGVEMEALTAVSVALLTIYDMCKAIDKKMSFTEIKLIKKEKV